MFLKLTASYTEAAGRPPLLICIADIIQIRPNQYSGARVSIRDREDVNVVETPQQIAEILEANSMVLSAPKEV